MTLVPSAPLQTEAASVNVNARPSVVPQVAQSYIVRDLLANKVGDLLEIYAKMRKPRTIKSVERHAKLQAQLIANAAEVFGWGEEDRLVSAINLAILTSTAPTEQDGQQAQPEVIDVPSGDSAVEPLPSAPPADQLVSTNPPTEQAQPAS